MPRVWSGRPCPRYDDPLPARIFLRNFRFLAVVRLLPSIMTRYWLNWLLTSTIVPVLDQRVLAVPAWFCTLTRSPTSRGARSWALALILSTIADSRSLHVSSHLLLTGELFAMRLCRLAYGCGRASRRRRPNSSSAGETPVLRRRSNALANVSRPRRPSSPVLSLRACLTVLTAASARLFDCAW